MDLASIVSATGTNFNDPNLVERNTGKTTLDVNDFLKLITVQLSSQDPLKPMEDTAFISQLASFTSLQQMRDLSDNFKSFTAEQRIGSAQNYLGKTVNITNEKGSFAGEVTSVAIENGAPKLIVGGVSYDPEDVTSIMAHQSAAPSTNNSIQQPMLGSGPSVPPANKP